MSAAATAALPSASPSSSPARHSSKPDGAPAVAAERAFQKLLQINYDVHHPVPVYTPPDHSWGEKFPGKQRSSTQLTLFSVGVKKRHS